MVKIVAIIGVVALVAIVAVFLLKNNSSLKSQPNPKTETVNRGQEASSEPDNDVYKVASSAKKGQYLTDMSGMALYTWDKDKDNSSSCDSSCTKTWMPYMKNANPITKPEASVYIAPTHTTPAENNIYVKPTHIDPTPDPINPMPTNINTFMRDNGMAQYSYKGHALYHYSGDKMTTDTNGDGMDGTWHLARP